MVHEHQRLAFVAIHSNVTLIAANVNIDQYAANGTLQSAIQTNSASDSMKMTLQNISAFIMYGNCNHDHGVYNMNVAPRSSALQPTSQTFNGSTRWLTESCLLYFQSDMDEAITYDVTMTNVDPSALDLTGVVTLSSG